MTGPQWKNKLYFGDNLEVLREQVDDESVDLIYLDPPFNSNANYNVLFQEKSGEESAAQITAFEDTWRWSMESESAYQEVVTQGPGQAGAAAGSHARVLGPERHDGLPDHDGPANGGATPGPEAHRQHLPALRPDGQPLPEDAFGRGVWAKEFSE